MADDYFFGLPTSNDPETLENRFVWWGASRLALWLADYLNDKQSTNKLMKNNETIANILTYLSQNKADMLNFLYSSSSVGLKLAPIRDKKGKIKCYKPVSMVWSGYSNKARDELEFISPQEYKYRDTAKILGDALNRAAEMLSLFTGKSKNELFNNLIAENDVEIPDELGKSVPVQKNEICAVFVISESDYEEKKWEYPKGMPLDVGFRVYKVE